jgi:hypothetical protein
MISGIFWSVWRRLFGWGEFKKVINRTVQEIIAIFILTFQLCNTFDVKAIFIALGISVWVIIQYWSRAIGEIIDAGLNNNQNAGSYDRWFRIPLDWIYDKLGKQKYVGTYDFWYSCIRYGIGAAPLCYYSWWALALIPLHYPIYLFCHKLYAKYPKLYQLPLTLNDSKNLAEVIHGFIFGLIVGLM